VEAALDNQLQPVPGSILYEHPLNERIRTFLRLEYLFKQAAHHVKRNSHWDSRATLNCILEILAVFGNTNLKSEVMKELERHAASLKPLVHNPDIDHKQLTSLLDDIGSRLDDLHGINGQIASDLKSSEFLSGIRQRSAIPGGTCDFDLPALHYWLQQPARNRTDDLYHWLGNFDAIGQAIHEAGVGGSRRLPEDHGPQPALPAGAHCPARRLTLLRRAERRETPVHCTLPAVFNRGPACRPDRQGR
jgi:hypothetical protein